MAKVQSLIGAVLLGGALLATSPVAAEPTGKKKTTDPNEVVCRKEEVLGSRSTTARFSIGGYQGRRLQKGDVLPLRHSVETLPGMQRRVLAQEPPEPGVRIVESEEIGSASSSR